MVHARTGSRAHSAASASSSGAIPPRPLARMRSSRPSSRPRYTIQVRWNPASDSMRSSKRSSRDISGRVSHGLLDSPLVGRNLLLAGITWPGRLSSAASPASRSPHPMRTLARPIGLGLAARGDIEDVVDWSRRARDAGLDSVWIHDSYFERDAVTFVTGIAAALARDDDGSGFR